MVKGGQINELSFSILLDKSKVKLISSDGECFTLDYEYVIQSGTIKSLLEASPSKIYSFHENELISMFRLVGT